MNTLKAVRQEIGLQLAAAGISCYEFVPERINVPAAVVQPGSPYMESGETFTDFQVRMNVLLLVRGTNETATDALDDLICTAVDALDTFDIESVARPEGYSVNNAEYLGAEVVILTNKELEL